MKPIRLSFVLFFLLFSSYSSISQTIKISLYPETTFQTINNFGASDAWSCQFVGNWPDKQKNQIADLLFSLDEKENGSPKGIGLSCWRFNIGAGSADQIGDKKINDRWRQTECFLQKDGSYDWNKQSGQRWFLRAAKDRGVENFLAFANSPPVWITKNGRANSDGGNTANLQEKNVVKFSRFLVETIQNIHKNEGVLFDYISPINEPQWDWTGGQEGTPWTNTEIAKFCRILGDDLSNTELSTKISISEAGLLTHLFERGNDAKRGYQIKEFFSPKSDNYIGNIPNMAHQISGHSYHTVQSDSIMNRIRKMLHSEIKNIDSSLDFWMSEYCILGGNGILKGGGRDLGMETALFVANIIHADLTVENACAWQWWIAISPYDYKDGLVYVDKNETGGKVYESKLLWTLGNYSRFIRPGAKRIKVDTNQNGILKTSAYKNVNGEIVVVVINNGETAENIEINANGVFFDTAKRFETSEKNNLTFLENQNLLKPITLSKNSITTFVIAP